MFSFLFPYSPLHSHELRLRAGLLLHELVAPLQRRVCVLLLVGGGEGEEAQRLHGEGQVRGVSQGVARVQVDPDDGRAVVLAPQDVALETETAEVQPEEDEEEDVKKHTYSHTHTHTHTALYLSLCRLSPRGRRRSTPGGPSLQGQRSVWLWSFLNTHFTLIF